MRDTDRFDLAELRGTVSGPVFAPGDEGYAGEVGTYNLNNYLEPVAAAGVTGVGDVRAVVRFAASQRRPVAVRTTGHQVARHAGGAILINTSRMDGVRIDAGSRTARVEAGVRWSAVTRR